MPTEKLFSITTTCFRPASSARNAWVGNGRNDTMVTSPMLNPSARISSMVSLIVPLIEPMATTSMSASSA